MRPKRVSEELLELVRQFKSAHTGEDRLLATIFADKKSLEEYKKLTYKEKLALEELV